MLHSSRQSISWRVPDLLNSCGFAKCDINNEAGITFLKKKERLIFIVKKYPFVKTILSKVKCESWGLKGCGSLRKCEI